MSALDCLEEELMQMLTLAIEWESPNHSHVSVHASPILVELSRFTLTEQAKRFLYL